jgi:hypothetical protein
MQKNRTGHVHNTEKDVHGNAEHLQIVSNNLRLNITAGQIRLVHNH